MDWESVWLSTQLATLSTALSLAVGLPLSYWISQDFSALRNLVLIGITLPLALPPTVLGFYLLILWHPESWLGQFVGILFQTPLLFSFHSLVLATTLVSLPFIVHPVSSAFETAGRSTREVALTLGKSRTVILIKLLIPLCRGAILSSSALCFVHALGEFGLLMMIGGSIEGETRVASIAIYDHVEAMSFEAAHRMSGVLLAMTCVGLWLAHSWRRPRA